MNKLYEHETPKACTATMRLLGDYWTLRIIDTLKAGEMRFCELQRLLDNLNPVTLSTRLKKLEDASLVARHKEAVDKISVSYSLTSLGIQSLTVVDALYHFSSKAQEHKKAVKPL